MDFAGLLETYKLIWVELYGEDKEGVFYLADAGIICWGFPFFAWAVLSDPVLHSVLENALVLLSSIFLAIDSFACSQGAL